MVRLNGGYPKTGYWLAPVVTRFQKWVMGVAAVLIAIRVFSPVQFVSIRGVRHVVSYWPGIVSHQFSGRFPSTEFSTTILHVIGILVLAGTVLVLCSGRATPNIKGGRMKDEGGRRVIPASHTTVSEMRQDIGERRYPDVTEPREHKAPLWRQMKNPHQEVKEPPPSSTPIESQNEDIGAEIDRFFDPDFDAIEERERQQASRQEYEEFMKSIGQEDYMKKADQFAKEFPWVRYADAPQPTPEEYGRALKRGTELFGREMKEIKTPRDYEREEEVMLNALRDVGEDLRRHPWKRWWQDFKCAIWYRLRGWLLDEGWIEAVTAPNGAVKGWVLGKRWHVRR